MNFFRCILPVFTALLFSSGFVHAQVPASTLTAAALAGKTLNLTIEGGEAPFVTSGSYSIALSASGKVYIQPAAGAVVATAGGWSHQSASPVADAVLTLSHYFPDGAPATLSLLDSGFFELSRNAVAAHQYGRFTISPLVGPLPGTPPTIVTQPVSHVVDFKSQATFSVVVSEMPGLVYQWRKDGIAIAGANSATLVLPAAQAADIGSYSVVVAGPQGVVASAEASLTINPHAPVITVEPLPVTAVAGGSATFSVVATGYPEPTYQWKFAGGNLSGATGATYTRTGLTTSHAGNYTCVVSNSVSSVTSDPAALTVLSQPGSGDSNWPAAAAVPVGAVHDILPLSSGKMLIGGAFNYVNTVVRPGLYRINANGSVDTSFGAVLAAGSVVTRIVAAPNNKFYILGLLAFNGTAYTQRIYRLNADGALDLTFEGFGTINFTINDLVVQNDGKVVIVGDFTVLKGYPRSGLARLNTDGSVDTTFNNGGQLISGLVRRVAIAPDGRIFIGGNFLVAHGASRPRIAAFTPLGVLDTTFDPGSGFDAELRVLQFQPDGKLLAGGTQTSYNGRASKCLTRLFNDGTWDPTFRPAALTASAAAGVYAINLQANGKIVVGGNFSKVDTTTRSCITRLLPGGAADPLFNPGVGTGVTAPVVNAIVLTGDDIVLGGAFMEVAGASKARLARLVGDPVSPRAPVIVGQPVSMTARAGDPATFTVLAEAYPVSYQWMKNGVDLAGEIFPSLSIREVVAGDGAGYTARVFNPSGAVLSAQAVLTVDSSPLPGSLDPDFQPPAAILTPVNAVLPQEDGKLLIGGGHSLALTTGLARVNADGTRDTTFTTKVAGTVYAMVRQPDGKILVAGLIEAGSSPERTGIVRLNVDGTLDTSFRLNTSSTLTLLAMALQPDGKILIGGYANGGLLARLNSNGDVDSSFQLAAMPNSAVTAISLQPDGKIVVTGDFTSVNNVARPGITRLTATGANDATLPTTAAAFGFTPNRQGVGVQSSGRLLLAATDGKIYRRNVDGTPSSSFSYSPPDTGSQVVRILVLPDDRILAVNYHETPTDGGPNYRLIRLQVNGSLDTSFVSLPGADNSILSLALAVDGRIAVAGAFTVLNGKNRPGVAMLEAENPFAPTFLVQPVGKSALSGASVTFSAAATGTPAPGYQWRLDGVEIPGATSSSLTVNPVLPSVVGNYSVKAVNSAGSAISSAANLRIARPPVIRSQPASVTTLPNTNVTFSVTAESVIQPFTYQWRKDGQALTGFTGQSIVLGNVTATDAGDYDVIVTNADGPVTSGVARLTLGTAMNPFDSFIIGHGLDPLTTGAATADPDLDGLNNLFEYIAGGNPLVAESRTIPKTKITERGNLPPLFSYEFDRRKDHVAAGVVIETGTALNGWQPAIDGADGISITAASINTTTEHVVVSVPVSAVSRFFQVVVR